MDLLGGGGGDDLPGEFLWVVGGSEVLPNPGGEEETVEVTEESVKKRRYSSSFFN